MLSQEGCPSNIRAIKDAIDIVDGRWRFLVLIALSSGNKRFGELAKEVEGISDKMLAKELKDLELNKLILRHTSETDPPVIEYSVTEHGRSLEKVMKELYQWGLEHRKQITGK